MSFIDLVSLDTTLISVQNHIKDFNDNPENKSINKIIIYEKLAS